MSERNWSLRELYRAMEESPDNPVSHAQDKLDSAVRAAYKMPKRADILEFLLKLNQECWEEEQKGIPIQGPGLPKEFKENRDLYSSDCVSMK